MFTFKPTLKGLGNTATETLKGLRNTTTEALTELRNITKKEIRSVTFEKSGYCTSLHGSGYVITLVDNKNGQKFYVVMDDLLPVFERAERGDEFSVKAPPRQWYKLEIHDEQLPPTLENWSSIRRLQPDKN